MVGAESSRGCRCMKDGLVHTINCDDVMLILKEGDLPEAAGHIPHSGLQTVPGRSAAAGERVWLRRGSHPSAQRRFCLPER